MRILQRSTPTNCINCKATFSPKTIDRCASLECSVSTLAISECKVRLAHAAVLSMLATGTAIGTVVQVFSHGMQVLLGVWSKNLVSALPCYLNACILV